MYFIFHIYYITVTKKTRAHAACLEEVACRIIWNWRKDLPPGNFSQTAGVHLTKWCNLIHKNTLKKTCISRIVEYCQMISNESKKCLQWLSENDTIWCLTDATPESLQIWNRVLRILHRLGWWYLYFAGHSWPLTSFDPQHWIIFYSTSWPLLPHLGFSRRCGGSNVLRNLQAVDFFQDGNATNG